MKLDSEVLWNLTTFAMYRRPQGTFEIGDSGMNISVVRNNVETSVPYDIDTVVAVQKTLQQPHRIRRIRAHFSRLTNMDLKVRINERLEQGPYEKWNGQVLIILTTEVCFELEFLKALTRTTHVHGLFSHRMEPRSLTLYERKKGKSTKVSDQFVIRDQVHYEVWVNDLLSFLLESINIARHNLIEL